ncbi:hypothetical protein [Bacillus sp. V2I10]|jgi:hypothetical protein|uniref:hypothetical protein n=1 Tax=Bacillus sp. V2I10 TaxID=3042276 RepID=UPI0027855B72|nr:hypothetical protein [Bacillus sp. V2I10]MDQ0859366.1 hypothetical protein [Bacillus sp. V2I10]
MRNSIFGYSFDTKPDPKQWNALKNKLSSSYSLPDTEMLLNLHRAKISPSPISVQEWFKSDTDIISQEDEDLLKRIKHLLPEDYLIPDVIRLKNIFIK